MVVKILDLPVGTKACGEVIAEEAAKDPNFRRVFPHTRGYLK